MIWKGKAADVNDIHDSGHWCKGSLKSSPSFAILKIYLSITVGQKFIEWVDDKSENTVH